MTQLYFPAVIPVRHASEAELAAAARASAALAAGRALADWFGDGGVDAESGWNSAHAQREAATTLGLVAGGGATTGETASRLHWIFEVACHAGYVQTSDDGGVISRAQALSGTAERTDAEVVADWSRALDALFAHGPEQALPSGADPAPLDFNGVGSFPMFKLLEQHGTATIETLSAEIAAGAVEGMTPSRGRQRWTAWTARHGDPAPAFLRLAEEFGAVIVEGRDVRLTPLGVWGVIQQLRGARIEALPAPGELTAVQIIICKHGMPEHAFEEELRAWLEVREPADAVTALLVMAEENEDAYLVTGVQIAAGIEGDTEAAWRSALSLPKIRPYAVLELNRRADRDPGRDPLPGVEPSWCDPVVIVSRAILAAYASHDPAGVAEAVRRAAAPDPETVLFEQMWRSRHPIAEQALLAAGKLHPDKKLAKAARAATIKATSARKSSVGR
jgi:hypothetical protein